MRLHYYHDSIGNVGDDLNPWLWPRLLPGFFDGRDDVLFFGIGTIFGLEVPAAAHKLVFGSGVGYGTVPVLDDKWDVRFVRGPLTAAALGLPPERAITDAALAIRLVLPAASGGRGVAFMPHHLSAEYADWQSICDDAGIRFIDARDRVPKVLEQIASCSMLIAEAMHGAILADALRVPWRAVRMYEHINQFKWNDWCHSLGLRYEATEIPPVFDGTWARFPGRQRLWLRQAWRARTPRVDVRSIPPTRTSPEIRRQATTALSNLARRGDGTLSTSHASERALSRINDELEKLRAERRAMRTA